MTRFAWLTFAAVLAACSTPQSRLEQNIASYRETCARMGATFGTPEYVRCVQNLQAYSEQERARQIDALGNALGAAAAAASAAQAARPAPPPAPIVCTPFAGRVICQ